MSARVIVYVELLDENVSVWRPVHAEPLGEDRYRLVDKKPEDEVWPFAVGDIVRCEVRSLDGSLCTVVYEKSN